MSDAMNRPVDPASAAPAPPPASGLLARAERLPARRLASGLLLALVGLPLLTVAMTGLRSQVDTRADDPGDRDEDDQGQ